MRDHNNRSTILFSYFILILFFVIPVNSIKTIATSNEVTVKDIIFKSITIYGKPAEEFGTMVSGVGDVNNDCLAVDSEDDAFHHADENVAKTKIGR